MSRWVQVHTKASSFDLPNVVFLGVIARDVAVLLLLQVWSNQRLETTDMMLMCMYTTRKRKLVLMNFSPYSIIPLLIHTSNRSQSLKNEYAIFFFLLSVWRIDKWSIVVFVTNVKMQTFYKIVQIFVFPAFQKPSVDVCSLQNCVFVHCGLTEFPHTDAYEFK